MIRWKPSTLTPVPVRGYFLAGLLVFVGCAVRIETAIRYRRGPASAGQDAASLLLVPAVLEVVATASPGDTLNVRAIAPRADLAPYPESFVATASDVCDSGRQHRSSRSASSPSAAAVTSWPSSSRSTASSRVEGLPGSGSDWASARTTCS